MQATIVPGVLMWSVWQPDRNMYFNSFFVKTGEGNFVVDPLAGDDALFERIEVEGGVDWIVITNRDHQRAAGGFAERFGAKIAASEGDAPLLDLHVDRQLRDDDLILGARVLTFNGLKTPGEIALWLRDGRALIVGDALWGEPAGSLRLMPPQKLADPAAAILSLRKLRAVHPEHVLVGDGACVFGNAMAMLQAVYETQDGVFVHRVNLDELVFQRDVVGKFASDDAEVGFLIGADRLGYRVTRLQPGDIFCPMHWHSIEEELFIVWEGAPSIRNERGTWRLQRGDLVAFPTRREGVHQLLNESDAPAVVIMIGMNDLDDDCFYPDSRKVLVGKADIIVRDHPTLDYYDGE